MTRLSRFFVLTALAVFALVTGAPAQVQAADAPPEMIQKLESYMNSFKTARARFVQTTHNGTQLVGTFYLSRPGKLRFEYDDPVKDFVVADGFFIYFYDAEAGEQSNAPIGQTLADFILRAKIALSGDVTITDYKDTAGIIQVTLVQSGDPDAGSLTLGFDKDPLTLKKWRVVDAQGLITEVELFYLKTDITHTDGLFAYRDPKTGLEPRYNQ